MSNGTLQRFVQTLSTAALAFVLGACAGERPDNLGVRDGRLTPCPASPNCVTSMGGSDRQHIAPLTFTGDATAALARLQAVLAARPDTKILSAADDYLRVEFHTTLFVDDGEFLLDRAAGRIEVRSASRLGYSDLGKNRSRLEEIRGQFLAAGR